MAEDTDPEGLELATRLMLSVQDWMLTPYDTGTPAGARLEAARELLTNGSVQRRRDQDGAITPDTDAVKKARFIVAAYDAGRTVKGGPWRDLRLTLAIRGNHHHVDEESFARLCGAVETLLDSVNLRLALTSAARAIVICVATRRDAAGFSVHEVIRQQSYFVWIRAVKLELTEP